MIVGETSKYFRTSKCLNVFLTDMRKFPLLSVQEEEELVLKAKAGDKEAKDRLINGNLRFIYSIAKIYARNEDELMDYVNEGVIGLEESLKAFDPTRGYKFFTYGVWYIRRGMNYYLMTTRDTVSRSAPVGQMAKKADTIRQKYFAKNGRMPSREEVKEILKETFNIETKNDEFLSDNSMMSIDEDVSDDYSVENSAIFNSATACVNDYETVSEQEAINSELEYALSFLTDTEADILKMKFGIGEYYGTLYSDEEIGEKYHTQAYRINRIIEKSIEYIRQNASKKAV